MTKPIARLRWWIAGALFLSTVINYIDRQTLSVLAPYIKAEFHWNNTTFAWLIIAFRAAYAAGQALSGRLVDRLGVRRALPLAVGFYSLTAMASSLAAGLGSFGAFRFLLGLGESANWPGAAKAVAEWFPKRESGWAVAIYDSGSAVGGAVAPFLVFAVYRMFGDWRPAFIATGLLGLLWIPLFRWLYHSPETHPRLSGEDRRDILANRADSAPTGERRVPYRELLRRPATWGIVLAKSLTDPVWFFITDWFAIYLVSKGYQPEQSLLAFWAPFLAADIGNFAGGGFSSWLIGRGWESLHARLTVAVACGFGMSTLALAAFTDSFGVMVGCFAFATFAYAGFSTIVLALPGDLYPTGSVASVSGLGGTGAGIGAILATYWTGRISDSHSFTPVLLAASLIPLVATAALATLVRGGTKKI